MAVLDSAERYEDSYAITQEFQEWIACIGQDDELLEASVLMAPRSPSKRHPFEGSNDDCDAIYKSEDNLKK